MGKINERTIWNSKQNHPELVVQDLIKEFKLNKKEEDKVRFILMNRGINKWLYGRSRFITLKHKVKEVMKNSVENFGHKHSLVKEIKKIQAEMQNIAKTPRWVEWDTHISRKMKKNIEKVKIKGKPC